MLLYASAYGRYDALGFELTTDYNERTLLFSCKTLFQFIGYLLSPLAGIVLGALLTDLLLITTLRSVLSAAHTPCTAHPLPTHRAHIISLRCTLRSPYAMCGRVAQIIFAALGLLAQAILLCCVKERSQKADAAPLDDTKLQIPLIPSVYRAMNNKPYMRYLALKVPIALIIYTPCTV